MSKILFSKQSKTLSLAKKIRTVFLDLLFPEFCVGCNLEGSLLCKKCVSKIVPIKVQVCPECLKLSENGAYCTKCRKGNALNGIFVATYFEEGPIKEMIHNFKYNHALGLKKKLSKLMAEVIPDTRIDIITFAPLHHRRLAERGFNQAQILAEEVSRLKKIPCQQLLKKIKSTKRQVGLTGEKRRENLKGVYSARGRSALGGKVIDIKNKTVLIIDDVTTTGATLNECAKILKKEGVKEVWGLVIARG